MTLTRVLEVLGEVGGVILSLRDKPTAVDYGAAAVRAAGLALKLRAEWVEARAQPWTYFDAKPWKSCPSGTVGRHMVAAAQNVRADATHSLEEGVTVCLGDIDGNPVGWLQTGDQISAGPYFDGTRELATYTAISDVLWRSVGAPNATYNRSGLTPEPPANPELVPAAHVRALVPRLRMFVDQNIPRAVLLAGPPGSGKSEGARWLAAELGLRLLRVDVQSLAVDGGDGDLAATVEAAVMALRPGILVLDDLDRTEIGPYMLDFLERARRYCSIIIGTANAPLAIPAAGRRPGRFDDVVEVAQLDGTALSNVTAALSEAEREALAHLPAAWVHEYALRRRVLGPDAEGELAELVARAEEELERAQAEAAEVAPPAMHEAPEHPGRPRGA